jgi:hypothetical protein
MTLDSPTSAAVPAAVSVVAPLNAGSRGDEGGTKAILILVVFSLHNAWNCWVFLNFTNFGPAEELLGVGDAEIGFVTTIGWLGILSTVPLVTLWQGDHRTLLFAAGLMNVAPPVLRYFAAVQGSYQLVVLSNFLQGSAFGVLGAWPAMLAALQWPEERRTLVTAIASLSNYVGGAVGVSFMPAMADTAPKLLEIFRVQSYVAAVLFVLMATWFWIPPARAGLEPGEGGTAELTLRQELRMCLTGRAGQQVLTFVSPAKICCSTFRVAGYASDTLGAPMMHRVCWWACLCCSRSFHDFTSNSQPRLARAAVCWFIASTILTLVCL